MNFLIDIRNRIERFVKAHLAVSAYVLRLCAVFISLLILCTGLGYNTFLSNIFVIIGLSVACGFIPIRFLPLVIIAYISIQLASLSPGPAAVVLTIFVLMYLLYFRFRKEYIYIMIAVPILCIIKGQLFIVLLLAAAAALDSAVAIAMGLIIYYILRYISINATILNSTSNVAETVKVSIILNNIFLSADFWISLAVLMIVFAIVRFICKTNVIRANTLAVVAGAAGYIVLQITAELLLLIYSGSMSMTYSRLWTMIIATLISMLLAVAAVNILLPQDFSRTVHLAFDDEEYYYYVRAVPKTSFEKERVSVKQINTRKTQSNEGSGE